METYRELDEISKDILMEIGNIGAGNAVTSLSQMMDQPIELEIPALKVLSYQEVRDSGGGDGTDEGDLPVYAQRNLYKCRNRGHIGQESAKDHGDG